MLEQEGLAEISQSSSSEQVAYMLVERATLLERLEAAERKLDTQTLTGNLREVHLQVELMGNRAAVLCHRQNGEPVEFRSGSVLLHLV